MEEIWRDVEGHNNYQVSSWGKVFKKGEGLCNIHNYNDCYGGYYGVVIDGKYTSLSRSVAKAFPEICGELKKGYEVHHIDHNRENNRADNLICLSKKEHIQFHRESLITKWKREESRKSVYQYDKDWNFLAVFDNTDIAAEKINGIKESICCACAGRKSFKNHYYKGYRWLYAD